MNTQHKNRRNSNEVAHWATSHNQRWNERETIGPLCIFISALEMPSIRAHRKKSIVSVSHLISQGVQRIKELSVLSVQCMLLASTSSDTIFFIDHKFYDHSTRNHVPSSRLLLLVVGKTANSSQHSSVAANLRTNTWEREKCGPLQM